MGTWNIFLNHLPDTMDCSQPRNWSNNRTIQDGGRKSLVGIPFVTRSRLVDDAKDITVPRNLFGVYIGSPQS